jgi:hypothetical protein
MSDTYTVQKGPFVVEVNLCDIHPGLTSEESLIATRCLDSSVNTVRVSYDLEPGEREEPLHSSSANTACDDTDSTVGGRGGGDSICTHACYAVCVSFFLFLESMRTHIVVARMHGYAV